MQLRQKAVVIALLWAAFCAALPGSPALAADRVWQVSKASGDFWVTHQGVRTASVAAGSTLNSGDEIGTGQNGRVLLIRGEESILISPNTIISIPNQTSDGMSTTIMQQSGSIALEVEKKNVKHFEVVTPYLAAVVKGTKFSVSVDGSGSHVDVVRGQVEVSANKSGDTALVLPGQSAAVAAQGSSGLTMSGAGAFNPIREGAPRNVSMVTPPVNGMTRPDGAKPAMTVADADAAKPANKPAGNAANGPARMTAPAAGQSLGLQGPGTSLDVGAATGSFESWMTSLFGGYGTWLAKNSTDMHVVGLPIGVFFAVAMAVSVQRRWRSRKRA